MLRVTIILAFGLSLAYSAAVIDDGAPTKVNKEEPKLPANPLAEPEHSVNEREGRAEGFQMDPVMANPYTYQTPIPGGGNALMQGSSYNFPAPPPPEVIRKAMEVLMSDSHPLVRKKPSRPAPKHGMKPLFTDTISQKTGFTPGVVGTVAVGVAFAFILGTIGLTLGVPLFGLKTLFNLANVTPAPVVPGKVPLPVVLPPKLPLKLKLPLLLGLAKPKPLLAAAAGIPPVPVLAPLPVPVPAPKPVPVPAQVPIPLPAPVPIPLPAPVPPLPLPAGGLTIIDQGNGENTELGILLPNNPTGAGIIFNDENYAENEAEAEARSSYTNMILPLLQHVLRGIEKYAEMNEKEE